MTEKLFDALETCLQAIERGETADSALARFPNLATELRPILETSLHVRTIGGFAIPSDTQRRGRARLLQRAAELREAKRLPRRTWLYTLRPLAVTLTVLFLLLFSGTGLVRASSTSLPGDGLYHVKRTWEDFRLAFAVNTTERQTLELSYENERVDEASELLASGRVEQVAFSGYVTAQNGDHWTVAGLTVFVSPDTSLPQTPIAVGAAVTVKGRTDARGFIVAQSIEPVAPGAVVPSSEGGNEGENGSSGGNDNGAESGTSVGGETGNDNPSVGGNENGTNVGGGDSGTGQSGEGDGGHDSNDDGKHNDKPNDSRGSDAPIAVTFDWINVSH